MFVFIVLKSILLLTLVLSGHYISIKSISGKFKYPYWWVASFPLIIYSLVEGLRYGRGADYISNSSLVLNAFSQSNSKLEPLFLSFNKILNYLNIPYPFAFIIYSFLLLGSCLLLIRRRREVAVWALPLFYLATIEQSENLVRQYVAFSILLISIKYLLDNEKKKFLILIICAFFTHYSSIIVLPFLLWFKMARNPFRNIYIILGLYVASALWHPGLESLVRYFEHLKIFNLYTNYLNNTNIWLLGEGIDKPSIIMSSIYYIRYYTFPALVLIFGYKILNKYRRSGFSLFYHLFFIGILFRQISSAAATEMLYRLTLYFSMFYFIVLAFILYDMFINFKRLILFHRIVYYYFLIDCSYLLIKTTWTFSVEQGYLFIWDN